jgi:predicted dehydrogenase
MQILIVGLGSIGLRHARNLQHLGYDEIIGVDPSKDSRNIFSDEIGGESFESLESLDKSMGPKLSLICSPSIFHVKDAIFCAKLGSHLMIEKPLSSDMKYLDKLSEIVRRENLYVHIGSNFKFYPSFAHIKTILNEGKIGKILSAQVLAGQWLPDWHPEEDHRKGYSARRDLGGGIISDTHEFDYITWLLGPVSKVIGLRGNSGILDIETEDVAAACLRFENGAICTVQVDYIQRDYKRRYTISGDKGTIEWDFVGNSLSLYSANNAKKSEFLFEDEPLNEMYIRQMRHVTDSVHKGNKAVTPLEQGIETLKIQLKLKGSDV